MSIDVMKQALHTLEGWVNHGDWVWPESALEQAKRNTTESITALRAAIEQAEKRQWIGLTDEEIMETVGKITTYRGEYEVAVGHAIEAKLKEKNG
jgi:DNA/RNA endonuclease YhcR with UshA esterase domain